MARADPLMLEYITSFPDEASVSINALGNVAGAELWETLPEELAVSLFTRLSVPLRNTILESASVDRLSACIDAGNPDEAAALAASLPRSRSADVLARIDKNHRTRLERTARQRSGSVGAVMSTDIVRLPASMPVSTALEQLRSSGNASAICALDEDGHLVGIIDPGQLLAMENAGDIIHSIVEPIEPLAAATRVDSIAANEQWSSHLWLPVVDRERRVRGALWRDRISPPTTESATSDAILTPVLTSFVDTMSRLIITLLSGQRK